MAAFLVKADFQTHIYAEIIDVITRAQDGVVDLAINNAIGEMKAYLNRYDLIKIFGDPTTDPATDPTFIDEYLKSIGKDIACWHLIKLANPNIDLKLFRTSYEDAISFLKGVMKGSSDPAWPLRQDDPSTPGYDEAGNIEWRTDRKRKNSY